MVCFRLLRRKVSDVWRFELFIGSVLLVFELNNLEWGQELNFWLVQKGFFLFLFLFVVVFLYVLGFSVLRWVTVVRCFCFFSGLVLFLFRLVFSSSGCLWIVFVFICRGVQREVFGVYYWYVFVEFFYRFIRQVRKTRFREL